MRFGRLSRTWGLEMNPTRGRLQDKVALITGAASGIGTALTRVFAQEGARVAAVDIDDAGLEAGRAQRDREGHTVAC